MTITRRTFLMSSGVVVAAPVLANVLPRFAEQHGRRAPASEEPVLKIEGWSGGDVDANAVWINVGPTWRTAWR
ncbi:MAG: hypothetical protein U1F41_15135 [Burkholderiales bacterium]